MTGRGDEALLGAFPGDPARVVWSSDRDPDSETRLEPSATSGSLPRTEFRFRLVNEGETGLTSNWYGWKLLKRVDDEWTIIAPMTTPKPAMSLQPGGSFTWELTVGGSGDDFCEQESVDDGPDWRMRVGPVGEGAYAFTVPVRRGDDRSLYAVEIDLRGSALGLTPTDTVSSVERRGETVVVHVDTDTDDPPAEYVVTRVDDGDAPADRNPLIPEEVVRRAELRNALAHFEDDVKEVVVETQNATEPPFALPRPQHISFRGDVYRIETGRPEEADE